MQFNSLEFIVFLPIVFAIYWSLNNRRHQNVLVLAASYLFYGWWEWRFLLLIAITTACSFSSGLLIQRFCSVRKWICGVNVVLNLAILAVFKYFDFFADNLHALATVLGWHIDAPTLNIVLPVGISFYTFQALSYTIDVYRGRISPTREVVDFFAYISFFPQLVAGPIERATELLPQFQRPRHFDQDRAIDGVWQMLWGAFKKMVIADNCAPLVDAVWAHPHEMGSGWLAMGVLLFAFQIYGDFSGYSDMAIGCARLFGIDLTCNFNYPYFARTIPDFWRRWHISLTTWFRDYVYIPLGGNRCAKPMVMRNVLLVWLLSGLWHGANWTFVCWGLYHAALLLFYRALKLRGNWLLTFVLVLIGWVIFRAPSIAQAVDYLAVMVRVGHLPLWQGMDIGRLGVVALAIVMMLMAEYRAQDRQHALQCCTTTVSRHMLWGRLALMAVVAQVILMFAGTQSQFIYFQF